MASNSPPVEIQQCVFGYDDGHRLLASSKSLSAADSSLLLLASDLAPGVSSGEDINYWTGFPLPDEQHFALLRTWDAPEISRPGCVWTHVLRIPFAGISRFSDLATLRLMMRRPVLTEKHEIYKQVIYASPERAEPSYLSDLVESRFAAFTLIESLYGRSSSEPLRRLPMIEEALFAVWSQQWPRLRRNFSFRTAVGPHGSPRELRLDIQISASSRHPGTDTKIIQDAWSVVAVDDLFEPQPSALRLFLWRYGSDIRRGFASFRILTDLYMETRIDRLSGPTQREVLNTVSTAFPDSADAGVLKTDLLAISTSPYSRLPPVDALGAWEFAIEQTSMDQWPISVSSETEGLRNELASRPEVAVRVAEKARKRSSLAARRFLETFTASLSVETFWKSIASHSELLRTVVPARPDLLDHEALAGLPTDDLMFLLKNCVLGKELAAHVVKRLLRASAPAIADLMWEKYREIVTDEMLDRTSTRAPSESWMRLITDNVAIWTSSIVLTHAARTRALPMIVEQLNPESPSVLAVGTQPWADALRTVSKGSDDLGMLTFVLIIALKAQGSGWEYLLERSFEPVYIGIMRRLVPPRLFDSMSRTFDYVPFWKEWDNCYRLTLTVAKIYVQRNGNTERLSETISDRDVKRRFLKIVRGLKRDNPYVAGIYDDDASDD